MTTVEIYTFEWCPWCIKAKEFFDKNNIKYINYDASKPSVKRDMIKMSGRKTVPQIFINDKHLGGYDDLVLFVENGGLKRIKKK
jgi:glutaredoxin